MTPFRPRSRKMRPTPGLLVPSCRVQHDTSITSFLRDLQKSRGTSGKKVRGVKGTADCTDDSNRRPTARSFLLFDLRPPQLDGALAAFAVFQLIHHNRADVAPVVDLVTGAV